ncbi:unnamed protein product [Clonostachys solani]|uniref:Zn(2)-C6 fungal-type domain-containing protein n=1 Tax=Clonostachys solani TaxID=160281 RepID=A0A9N9ZIC3_9HYPO|nr:unnamed protein product [Clonostachys solani]
MLFIRIPPMKSAGLSERDSFASPRQLNLRSQQTPTKSKQSNPMETRSLASIGHKPAPYGHACTGCSKAKCKCISRGVGVPCERCHRLLKQCSPSTVVRKGLSRRVASQSTRERASDKPSSHREQQVAIHPVSEHTNSRLPAPAENSLAVPYHMVADTVHAQSLGTRIACAPPILPNDQPDLLMAPSVPALSPPLELCPVDAEAVLKTFKELHLKSFPFIYFEESLRITDRIRDRKFLGVCSGVAASLVFDLRLDRVVAQENPYKETDIGRAYTYPIPQHVPSPGRTNEERRAVLACFCICTAISELLESPPMRWTSDMEASLQHLASYPEVLHDRILVAIVKVFKIIDAVSAASTSRHLDMYAERDSKLPPAVYTSYLVNRLDSLKSELSPDILNETFHAIIFEAQCLHSGFISETIRSYISYVEASINDLPLHRQANPADGNSWLDFRKAEHLHACLNACRQHLDNWSHFTIDELYCMSMPVHWYFARCTQILYRLSLMNDPSWDKKTVRNAVDLLGVMEATAQRFLATAETKRLDVDSVSWFTKAAGALRHAASIWGKALSNDSSLDEMTMVSQQSGSVDSIPGVGIAVPADLTSDDWMMDLWTEWQE